MKISADLLFNCIWFKMRRVTLFCVEFSQNLRKLWVSASLFFSSVYGQSFTRVLRMMIELMKGTFIFKDPTGCCYARTLELGSSVRLSKLSLSGSVMSNNSAATSSLAIAQKTVKQLRLEASVRRIKVGLTSILRHHLSKSELSPRMSITCQSREPTLISVEHSAIIHSSCIPINFLFC